MNAREFYRMQDEVRARREKVGMAHFRATMSLMSDPQTPSSRANALRCITECEREMPELKGSIRGRDAAAV